MSQRSNHTPVARRKWPPRLPSENADSIIASVALGFAAGCAGAGATVAAGATAGAGAEVAAGAAGAGAAGCAGVLGSSSAEPQASVNIRTTDKSTTKNDNLSAPKEAERVT